MVGARAGDGTTWEAPGLGEFVSALRAFPIVVGVEAPEVGVEAVSIGHGVGPG